MCCKIKILWKLTVIGLLLIIIGQLRTLEKNFERYFDIPDVTYEEPQDGKDLSQ